MVQMPSNISPWQWCKTIMMQSYHRWKIRNHVIFWRLWIRGGKHSSSLCVKMRLLVPRRAIHTSWTTFSHLHYQIAPDTRWALVLAKAQWWRSLWDGNKLSAYSDCHVYAVFIDYAQKIVTKGAFYYFKLPPHCAGGTVLPNFWRVWDIRNFSLRLIVFNCMLTACVFLCPWLDLCMSLTRSLASSADNKEMRAPSYLVKYDQYG